MQQFTPFFPGYESQQQQQPQQQQHQQQNGQPQDQQQQQQQQPLNMNGPNLAIYTPAAMQPLSVLAAAQRKEQQQQQPQQQQVQQVQQLAVDAMTDIGAHGKPKRKQVKNACVNCQKACKKCDIGRPCQRCIKYGLTDTCVNSVRKERKKGVKRGPYKKRNKSGGESGTSSGASTPNMASPMTNANLYAQNAAVAGVRPNATTAAMPMHYQPFPTQGHYDPYAYANSSQMMPQAYMVPAAIQQMYPTNPPVLSYQAAMNMISPQQQQQQQGGGYRLQEQQLQQQQSPNPANSNNASATGTPTNSTTPATTTTNEDGSNTAKVEDDDDEGSKLTILSQLCSAVLDRNDQPKEGEDVVKSEESTHQNTPPPSRPHSREASQDTNNNATNNTNNNETVGHNFGTSPSDSPVDPLNFNKAATENSNNGQWNQPTAATHEQQS